MDNFPTDVINKQTQPICSCFNLFQHHSVAAAWNPVNENIINKAIKIFFPSSTSSANETIVLQDIDIIRLKSWQRTEG